MSSISHKIVSAIGAPFRAIFLNPKFRYKILFSDVIGLHPDEMMLKRAMEFAAHTNTGGDYLEFGVWKGRSFSRAFHIWKYVCARNTRINTMRFYAFDSFEGLPPIISDEDKATGEFTEGQYACSEKDFRSIIVNNGVDLTKVSTVKGWFDKVLNEKTRKSLPVKKAAIVFVDSDLYDAAVDVLDFIEPYVADGTVIIFDDWFCFRGNPSHGEQKAFRDWLKKNPRFSATEFHKFNWKGNSFIIHC